MNRTDKLRDKFAGMAMQAALTNDTIRRITAKRNPDDSFYDEIAKESYKMADAMLRAK